MSGIQREYGLWLGNFYEYAIMYISILNIESIGIVDSLIA